jgi:hypothetical protein
MLYRRETNFRATRIGDADELMQELFNASHALNRLDQNNFKDDSITPARAVPSSVATNITKSLTVGQKNGALLTQVLNDIDVSAVPNAWVTSSNALDLVTAGALRMRLYAYGQFYNAAGDVSRLDVRFLIDGDPGGRIFTHNMARPAGVARFGWDLTEEVLLGPGSHTIRVQARDRSDTAGELRQGYAGTADKATVMAIGYRP